MLSSCTEKTPGYCTKNEDCESTSHCNLPIHTCQEGAPDSGLADGKVADSGLPKPGCNNGKIDSDEKCDGQNLNNATCESLGFRKEGTLKCNPLDCTYDTSGCTKCGDGKKNGDEECDAKDLGGKDCTSFGYALGDLACKSTDCTYSLAGCKQKFITITVSGNPTFSMGSPSSEPCRSDDETQHTVKLTHNFEMKETEVTQDEFKDLMVYNPSSNTGCANCPVENVNWYEAAAYCNELSKKTHLDPLHFCYSCTGNGKDGTLSCNEAPSYQGEKIYTCPGYRLPTEAEWEYAYRAHTTHAYYYQDYDGNTDTCTTCPLDSKVDKIAWYCANSQNKTHPVRGKIENTFLLYDMAGNVFEWCNDWFGAYPSSSATTIDPWGGSSGNDRVMRGGSIDNLRGALRAAYRGAPPPTMQDYRIGFRVARNR